MLSARERACWNEHANLHEISAWWIRKIPFENTGAQRKMSLPQDKGVIITDPRAERPLPAVDGRSDRIHPPRKGGKPQTKARD